MSLPKVLQVQLEKHPSFLKDIHVNLMLPDFHIPLTPRYLDPKKSGQPSKDAADLISQKLYTFDRDSEKL